MTANANANATATAVNFEPTYCIRCALAIFKLLVLKAVYSVGRLDDVLVLSSGEKTVPGPMEVVIGSSRYVAGVCMFGHGRNQTGVLVEPRPEFTVDVKDEKQVAAFRNLIWSAA